MRSQLSYLANFNRNNTLKDLFYAEKIIKEKTLNKSIWYYLTSSGSDVVLFSAHPQFFFALAKWLISRSIDVLLPNQHITVHAST